MHRQELAFGVPHDVEGDAHPLRERLGLTVGFILGHKAGSSRPAMAGYLANGFFALWVPCGFTWGPIPNYPARISSPPPKLGYFDQNGDVHIFIERVTEYLSVTPLHYAAGTPAMSVPLQCAGSFPTGFAREPSRRYRKPFPRVLVRCRALLS
jgi:hypothetical protein